MSAIPSSVQAVLDLFAAQLAEVRFADIDQQTLIGLAAEVEAAAEEVSARQSALDAARSALQERQDLLLSQAQRALAYARVYAESDEELSGKLASIALPRAPRKNKEARGSSANSANHAGETASPSDVPAAEVPDLRTIEIVAGDPEDEDVAHSRPAVEKRANSRAGARTGKKGQRSIQKSA